ncbi:sugar phosphate nucleotidyltransferase [Sphingorhabdus sp. M41]|uniref:sugar phosphate nucleotidyltransferase n=1 Tax=Sphingorhabdus sp. M41 TaxID=1806885 RepID=UPI00078E253A|nr:sugar phosphate nucleotidyltransferase [Sphingorhabdus sp. M41]AMO73030.1 hypothetical protein AZE99_15275 [Sphingorhabdus sp. M41]
MRLWPLSTAERPKKFLNLAGSFSLFQQTIERCKNKELFAAPTVVSGASHAKLVTNQLGEMNTDSFKLILEPCARNTSPAIALAVLACENPRDIMLVMPIDPVILDGPAFLQAVRQSLPLAKTEWLVTFGLAPAGPETGYGYIQQGSGNFGEL